ncbi:superoxide dismutase family protein [Alteriqipengyuania lutimaris]|uniref:Superoxide dismutase family protein n=1 Tax=Alteriqipengyuania lutimaris TaxID=1538146 RepID=A0A395LM92_9SPHN|nr:superoxide dismutase family protein [Alteriqipengyuania lutimaris]MBB3034530.1 Cu-Zn family superoxide dismutase [Alteriqipengyuania lutimaris]RDS76584.1 superoxide dismutase family protein [Alteriqipengyuania lutimaris]
MINPIATGLKAAAVIAPACLLAACATTSPMDGGTVATADLVDRSGSPMGEARLMRIGDSLELAVTARGLEPGEHGFHLHTTGRCQVPDFTSAGGHLNPTNEGHGLLDDDGSHLGDLPNLEVRANGTASVQVPIRGMRSTVMDQIFDSDGTAIVIHADPDDGRTDPSGNAGNRMACGVLMRS